jgi:hypothetical protein
MQRAPAGFEKTPLGAPIMTPPAKEAFKMSSIENFSRTKAVMIKVPRQLPVRAMIVFTMIRLLSYGEVGKKPALKEGQNIHKNKVPIKENIFEV